LAAVGTNGWKVGKGPMKNKDDEKRGEEGGREWYSLR